MQASVRPADRVVVQVGQSLGVRVDCDIVELSAQQQTDLQAALAQPHGNVYLSVAGAVTFDPPSASSADPLLPDKVRLWRYMPASGHANAAALSAYVAAAAADDPLALTILALRSLIRIARGDLGP